MKNTLLSTLSVLMIAIFASGCLVVSEETTTTGHYETQCYDDCEDIEVCERVCDDWECWDTCWIDTVCDTICEDVYVETEVVEEVVEVEEEVEVVEEDPVEKPEVKDDAGTAGLCQACESNNDCTEEGALCLNLNLDDGNTAGQTVCTRPCEINADCPSSFECVNVGSATQCLPITNDFGRRSCTANDLECTKASDCSVGESCKNNICTSPKDEVECESDKACGEGKTCEDFKCVTKAEPAACTCSQECGEGEVCTDKGVCKTPRREAPTQCQTDCECASGQTCEAGRCK